MIKPLDSAETVVLGLLITSLVGIPVAYGRGKWVQRIWSPLMLVSLSLVYYGIISPLYAVYTDDTFQRGQEHRQYLLTGWLAILLSYVCLTVGFFIFTKKGLVTTRLSKTSTDIPPNVIFVWVRNIWILVLFILFVQYGFSFVNKFKPTNVTNEDYTLTYVGSLSGYLLQSSSILLFANVLSLLYLLKTGRWILPVALMILTAFFFINEGFRYRLVLLLVSLVSFYYLRAKTLPRVSVVLIVGIPFFLLMGTLEIARSYGHGIDTAKLSGVSRSRLYSNSFNEGSSVFLATSYLVEKNERFSDLYFVFNAIAMPIPRALWPNKPGAEYLFQANLDLYGRIHASGQAYLYYAEYYMSFGWVGIIIFSFLLGLLMQKVWRYYLRNDRSDLHMIFICLFNAFLYVVVSRGYLAQQLTLFFFTAFPALWAMNYAKKFKKKDKIESVNQTVANPI